IFGLWALFRGFVSYNITFIGLIYNLIITPECAFVKAVSKRTYPSAELSIGNGILITFYQMLFNQFRH
ncbi:MAG: hypothetical protein CSA36_04055, partial [Draconibacterium sp.]